MSARKQPEKRDLVHRDWVREVQEFGNTVRNERQKIVFLCEVGRIHRKQISDAIESAKQILEKSKKLCESSAPEVPSRRKRAA